MKRILTTIAIICATVITVMAQPRDFGVRVGYNFELSYQHATSSGMVEIDAGVTPFLTYKGVMYVDGEAVPQVYNYGRTQLTLVYDWLMDIVPNLDWYLGPAVGVTWGYGDFFDTPHYDKHGKMVTERRLGLPIGLQVGMEYEFKAPVILSVDWRPMVNVFGFNQFDYASTFLNLALCLRYRF
jgi:hypothetical protein